MEKQKLIDRLTELEQEIADGITSKAHAVVWASEAAPLLRFDEGYHREFRDRAAKLNFKDLKEFQDGNLMRMIAIVHEAIADLEAGVTRESRAAKGGSRSEAELEPPKHVTLAWLWSHVPWGVWTTLAGAAVVVFWAGITFGRSDLYERLTTPHSSAASGPGKAASK
jgi:hypothetical protein